jgi:hypothetical protein
MTSDGGPATQPVQSLWRGTAQDGPTIAKVHRLCAGKDVSTELRSEGQLLAGMPWKGRACRLVVVDLPYV